MRATFTGLEIARRSLQAHRFAMDVTGHNIANANTPGYSRQIARLVSTDPYTSPSFNMPAFSGQLGTGVRVAEIVRMKDEFVQQQIVAETQTLGYWSTRDSILRELELTFLEPSESGIRNTLDQFFIALQELSTNPESRAVRALVRERAIVLADTIRTTYQQLDPLRKQLDSEIRAKVSEINSIAAQIADITREISMVIASGDMPNDLFDKRENLVRELARIADITVIERSHGHLVIGIGGVSLVDGVHHREIVAADTDGDGFADLTWSGTNIGVSLRSGELAALVEGRDELIPGYMDMLNDFARDLIVRVNEIHNAGYGLYDAFDPNQYEPIDPDGGPPPAPPGRDFFKDDSDDPKYLEFAAAYISLADDILADASNIAASFNGAIGDGSNALRLASLKDERFMSNGTSTPGDYFSSMISELGVQAQKAARMVEHQEVLLGHLERLDASVSGVSLDEELTKLVQYQHAFAAASRLITTVDEAIDVIINRMGLVGR